MNAFQMEALYALLERIAKALEATNDMQAKVMEEIHHATPEQAERMLVVQEQDAETRKRNADAWEEHNLWHRQGGSHPEDHPRAH